MIESTAFQCGVIFCIASFLFNIIIWMLAVINGVRIEKVAILTDPWFSLYSYKSNKSSTEILLGWFPFSSYIKLAGMIDESMDKSVKNSPKDYELRSKALPVRMLIMVSSSVVFLLIGTGILMSTSSLSIVELLLTYLKITFFIIPIEEGDYLWAALSSDMTFLAGFVFLLVGVTSLAQNVISLFGEHKVVEYMSIAFFLLSLFFLVMLFRLLWMSFSVNNVLYYLAGTFLVALPAIILSIILAKILPNPS